MLRRFVMPDLDNPDAEIWEVSTKPLLILTIKPKEKTKEEKEKEKAAKKDKKKKAVKVDDKTLINFSPSQETVQAEL